MKLNLNFLKRQMANQARRRSQSFRNVFSIEKMLDVLNTEIHRENLKRIVREPYYKRQQVNQLLCMFELLPIYNNLETEETPKLEALICKLILRFTSFESLRIEFPEKLRNKLKNLKDQVWNKYESEERLNEDLVETFDSTVEDLYQYLLNQNYALIKAYWEERLGPNSVVIRSLVKDGFL